MERRRSLFLLYLLVVLYAVAYQLQRPLEPFLVDALTKDSSSGAEAYANLQSFFGVVQVFGSLLVGNLIDKLGIRAAFCLNFLSCAAAYGVLAQADSIEWLFLSKVPTVFMAGFLCAQAAAAKLTQAGNERVIVLGRLTTSYTIGGTFGPALGGWLGTSVAAPFAVALSVLAGLLALMLPADIDASDESVAASATTREDDKSKPPAAEAPYAERVGAVLRAAGPLLLTKFLSAAVNSMNHSVQPRILMSHFGVTEAELGMFMSAVFFSTAVVSGVLMKPMMGVFGGSEPAVIRTCLAGMSVGLLVSASSLASLGMTDAGKATFIGLAFLLATFQYPLATTITARSTSTVPSEVKGTLMGLEHALHSGSGILGPRAGFLLVEQLGFASIPAASSLMYVGLWGAWTFPARSTAAGVARKPGGRDEAKAKLG